MKLNYRQILPGINIIKIIHILKLYFKYCETFLFCIFFTIKSFINFSNRYLIIKRNSFISKVMRCKETREEKSRMDDPRCHGPRNKITIHKNKAS